MDQAEALSPLKQVLFNFHDVVLLITAYLCILFALLILTRKGSKTQNALFAGFLLCHAAIPFDLLISFGEAFRPWIAERAPSLFHVFGGAYWLDAPILLWYTRSLLYKDFHFKPYDLIFLIPFVYFVLNHLDYALLTETEQIALLQQNSVVATDISERVTSYVRELIRFCFFAACAFEVFRYRKHILHEFSNIEKIDFQWLNTTVIGFTALILWQLLVMTSLEMNIGYNINVNWEALGLTGNYATLGLVSFLIFYSLSHSVVFEGIDREAIKERETKAKKPAFEQNDIDKLSKFMLDEKPYLNSDLNIDELAKLSRINHRQLSNMMNQHFKKNFFEFVNYYRIEEAKVLLKSESHKSSNVLDIMYEVGFNSKATFNTFFKKNTGLTPSQYRKSEA